MSNVAPDCRADLGPEYALAKQRLMNARDEMISAIVRSNLEGGSIGVIPYTPGEFEPADGVTAQRVWFNTYRDLFIINMVGRAEIPTHVHTQTEIVTVLEGRVRFTIGDEVRVLAANETIFVPSNIPHSVEALTDTIISAMVEPPIMSSPLTDKTPETYAELV